MTFQASVKGPTIETCFEPGLTPEVARRIQDIIRGAYKPQTGVVPTLLGLASLAFGASSVFVELQNADEHDVERFASP